MTHDPHDGLSPSARALLGRASAPRPRTPEERRRTTQRVARLAVAPLVAGGAWFSWKGALLAAALVAGGIGVAVTRRSSPPTSAPGSVAPRVVTPRAVARVEEPAPRFGPPAPRPAPLPAPTPGVVARATRPVVSPARLLSRPVEPPPTAPVAAPTVIASAPGGATAPVVAHPTEDDMHRLERARQLLGSEPSEALRLAESVSSTEVVEERELIAMDALHRLGRGDALRARGQRFIERFPRSLYAERVRRWLRP